MISSLTLTPAPNVGHRNQLPYGQSKDALMNVSLSLSHGVFRPGDIAVIQRVFEQVTSELWFSRHPDRRVEFARYIFKMYMRGLVVPEQLEALCRLAARKRFAADFPKGLAGRHFLLVEDEYFVAREASLELQALGVEVVGPVGSVGQALETIEREDVQIDAALLDIRLADEVVFPVAALLKMKDIPFVFVTGYDDGTIPSSYENTPTYAKPVNWGLIARAFARERRFEAL